MKSAPAPVDWKRLAILWLPLIAWALLLFVLSSYQYPEKTAVVTGIEEQVDSIDIPSISIRSWFPQQTLANFIQVASKSESARRTTHTLLYLVLGLLGMRAVRTTTIPHPGWVTWLAGTLYGLTDEVHQIFVPGRTFQLLDILVDSLGVLIGLLLYQFLIRTKTHPKPPAEPSHTQL